MHKTRDMYKRINDLKGEYMKRERFLKNNNGSLITTNEELAEKWENYFDNLLNCEEPNEVFSLNLQTREGQDCLESFLEEIRSQINTLKTINNLARIQFMQKSLKKEEKN